MNQKDDVTQTEKDVSWKPIIIASVIAVILLGGHFGWFDTPEEENTLSLPEETSPASEQAPVNEGQRLTPAIKETKRNAEEPLTRNKRPRPSPGVLAYPLPQQPPLTSLPVSIPTAAGEPANQ